MRKIVTRRSEALHDMAVILNEATKVVFSRTGSGSVVAKPLPSGVVLLRYAHAS
jgi:hypothetical protein